MSNAGPETIVQAGLPRTTRRQLLAMSAVGLAAGPAGLARAAGPSGQVTIASHVSLAPTWFDPAETSGIITPYMLMYAMHDALAKDMPSGRLAMSLAETSCFAPTQPSTMARRYRPTT
jgi:peptide/nickel transport system substrate-binding protein